MNLRFRAARPALILLLALSAPLRASEAPSALPPLPAQADPWLYRGSDVPRDKEWSFGTLPNGLRWAVRKNGVPPGQVSIRVRIDVGSLYEGRGEEGFAHLLEHLVFRQSKYLGQAQAIPTWQRLGATFGSDTNAETTPTGTTFKIDLPGATPASLDESFKLLSGMVIYPTLSEADVRTEVPIVLAEKREHGGAGERVVNASRGTLFGGQPLGDHSTIGTVASLEAARQDPVRAFHARWYRPENAVIVAVGDADPQLLAALATKWFGDWHVPGPLTPAPSLGAPVAPAGADPANPVGATTVLVEPELPRGMTVATVRAWHEKNDTIAYNQGNMIDQIAQAIINRRLESRARRGGSFLTAQVGQENVSRSTDATFVNLSPLDGNWRGALAEVRGVIADAMAKPPSAEEIAREVAENNVAFESQVQQRSLLPGARLADELMQAVDIHETVANPETVWELFRHSVPLFTPQAVLEHTRRLFAGTAVRAFYVTPTASDGDGAALRAELLKPAVADGKARLDPRPVSFADQPAVGVPASPVAVNHTGLLGIEQVDFANGVKALIWPSPEDPGRVTVKVRFGTGYQAFTRAQAPYVSLASLALVGAGEGKLGQDELDRISTGRKMGFDFKVADGSFVFSADTRAEDLADQLYLFAAKLAMPRWDAAPVARALAASRLAWSSMGASPQGVLERELRSAQRGGDPRFRPASPAELAGATAAGFRSVWEPILSSGPIEVQVFGDFDRAKGIDALARTFGALAPRRILPAVPVAMAAPAPQPLVLHHKGDANQAAALVSWPTGGGVAGTRESRQLEVLAQLFANRLLDAMREKLGASYAPDVRADWPADLPNGGTITAMAQVPPDSAPRFFAAADAIAADLVARPVSADELARVTEPLRQQITRATSSSAFFMWQLEGATQAPARFATIRTLLGDYADATPATMQALAAKYLIPGQAWRLAVLPGQ